MKFKSEIPTLSLYEYIERRNKSRDLKDRTYRWNLFSTKPMLVAGLLGMALVYPFLHNSGDFIIWFITIITWVIYLLSPKSNSTIEIPF